MLCQNQYSIDKQSYYVMKGRSSYALLAMYRTWRLYQAWNSIVQLDCSLLHQSYPYLFFKTSLPT